ncbi:MAG: hypothetical protein ACRCUQ_03265 [Alphaproteobacteria bacterium]
MKQSHLKPSRHSLFSFTTLALLTSTLSPTAAAYAGPQNYEVEKTKPIKKPLPAGVDCEGMQQRLAKAVTSLLKTQEEAIYQRFLNGVLIYRPDPNSDVGKVEFRIADFENPLEGTFDFSRCGDTWQYLSISTGYRKKFVFVNKSKVEIFITPRFLVEGNLTGDASYFKSIMNGWNGRQAPVGLMFNWGGWNEMLGERHYDYLTTESMDQLSNGENFYSKWNSAQPTPSVVMHHSWRHTHVMEKFSLKFPAK